MEYNYKTQMNSSGSNITRVLEIEKQHSWSSEKKGWGIYDCKDTKTKESLLVVGFFTHPLGIGEVYKMSGRDVEFRGMPQFRVSSFTLKKTTEYKRQEIIDYLNSLSFDLRSYSEYLYDNFKDGTIEAIKTDQRSIIKKLGVSKDRVYSWANLIRQDESKTKVLDKLLKHGLDSEEAKKLVESLNETTVICNSNNPYFAAAVTDKISFSACDAEAKKEKLAEDDPLRIAAIILDVLKVRRARGHIASTLDDVLDIVKKRYGRVIKFEVLDKNLIKKAINVLSKKQKVVIVKNNALYLKKDYDSEYAIATRLNQLSGAVEKLYDINLDDVIDGIEKGNSIEFTEKQRDFLFSFSKNRLGVNILQGGPGTGKTFLLKYAVEVFVKEAYLLKRECRVLLLAPTGRASQRLSEATGQPSLTVHAALGFRPDGTCARDENDQIFADLIVVDEASMLSYDIASKLLLASNPQRTKVLFVGDFKQLPPIEAGNFFYDICGMPEIPREMLDRPLRQAADSPIVQNAHQILKGNMLVTDVKNQKFIFCKVGDDYKALYSNLDMFTRKLLEADVNINDICVLAPSKQGVFGTSSLNMFIQAKYNPVDESENKVKAGEISYFDFEKGEEVFGPLYFRVGDKVVQKFNNYAKANYNKYQFGDGYEIDPTCEGIFNGQIGVVHEINTSEFNGQSLVEVVVKIGEDRFVKYTENELYQLELGYAITIHKSQGSEWPYVFVAYASDVKGLLNRNLLYTAVTRAKKRVFVAGKIEDVELSLSHSIEERKSGLSKTFEVAKKTFVEEIDHE